jgi:uncharacterized short protein YbdD (DUF466 family)
MDRKLVLPSGMLFNAIQRVWFGLREWCGDAAYERYTQSCARSDCKTVLMSREEFYLSQLHKKYSRVSRCC